MTKKNVEKEIDGFKINEILNDFGEPKEIVKSLLSDRTSKANFWTKVIMNKRNRILIFIVWIFIGLLLFISLQNADFPLLVDIILVSLNIALFSLLFVYKKMKIKIGNAVTLKTTKSVVLYQIVIISIVYFNLLILFFFARNPFGTPILSSLPISTIGPFVHYQIVVGIILCFLLLYFTLIKSTNKILYVRSVILGGISIVVLNSLNKALSSVDSIFSFDKYIIQQLFLYTISIIVIIWMKVIINRRSRRIK